MIENISSWLVLFLCGYLFFLDRAWIRRYSDLQKAANEVISDSTLMTMVFVKYCADNSEKPKVVFTRYVEYFKEKNLSPETLAEIVKDVY